MTRRRRAGFTAQEIMIALMVIGIGNVFVLHACRHGREVARTASCGSNVKQIALAMRIYATDADGRLPPGPEPVGQMIEYIKNKQIFACPADREPRPMAELPSLGGPWELSYVFSARPQLDDDPGALIVADDAPDRHGGRWQGARLDGALHLWPADQWAAHWGTAVKGSETGK